MKRELPTFQINWGQVVTSLLIGAIVGAFTLIRLSDTNTIIIAGQAKAIENLETSTVSIDLFKQHAAENQREFDTITKSLDSVSSKLDRLLLK